MDTAIKERKLLISVCIATYKREAQLEKLLKSLYDQELHEKILLEIIVTDNNAEQSAREVVERFERNDKIKLKYFAQPEKNISLTRNVCVINATGDYLCFIDDDETADRNWVQSFYYAIKKYSADGAFGYVEPVFDKRIPVNLQKREYYFSPVCKTGSTAKFYFTTNAIVKASFIKTENGPFDPAYGLTGGEDVHLFERLEKKGARFIDCKEAKTFEFIPIERGNLKYLFNRAQRGGQSYIRRKLEFNHNLLFRLWVLLKALIQIVYNSIKIILRIFSRNPNTIINIGASIGKIRSIFKKYKKLY